MVSPLSTGHGSVPETIEGRDTALLVPSSRSSREENSVPFPLTRVTTPPFGSVRSTSAPLHPTRASRERLKAALETLDLKEHLKPTLGDTTTRGSTLDEGGQGDTAKGGQEEGVACASGNDSLRQPKGGKLLRSDDGSSGHGSSRGKEGRRLKIGAVAFGSDGGEIPAATAPRSRGRAKVYSDDRVSGISLEAEHGEGLNYISMEAAETIGRLRARVTELELSEQVCEHRELVSFSQSV